MRTSNQRRFQRGGRTQNHSRNTSRQYNRNTSFESNGPNMRLRGTAQQLAEKYQQHARDAGANGDFVLRENYLQHAEYYYRMFEPLDQQNNNAETQNDDADMNSGDAQADGGQSNDGYDNSGYENNGRGNSNYSNGRQENGGQPRQRRRRWEMSGNNSSEPRNAPNNSPNNPSSNPTGNAPNNSSDADNGAQDITGGDNNSVATGNSPASNNPVTARKTAIRKPAVRKTTASESSDPFNGDMPSFLNVDDK
ncbi:MAG: DUF4167 domain-containing protein [Alphaproteobacteria bacterium]|nr:DUF4167 domain-containing protein [Alphaproteobacteria bacterium]